MITDTCDLVIKMGPRDVFFSLFFLAYRVVEPVDVIAPEPTEGVPETEKYRLCNNKSVNTKMIYN